MTAAEQPQPIICPFTIVVDSNESAPYRFTGIPVDGDRHRRSFVVHTQTRALWAMARESIDLDGEVYRKGLADYSIAGHEERVQIERKSVADLYSTLGGRRKDFQAEIARLNQCDFAAVVVEGSWHDVLQQPPNSQLLPKVVSRTIISWSVRYPCVHWFLCYGRRHAELVVFRLLYRWWELKGGET